MGCVRITICFSIICSRVSRDKIATLTNHKRLLICMNILQWSINKPFGLLDSSFSNLFRFAHGTTTKKWKKINTTKTIFHHSFVSISIIIIANWNAAHSLLRSQKWILPQCVCLRHIGASTDKTERKQTTTKITWAKRKIGNTAERHKSNAILIYKL